MKNVRCILIVGFFLVFIPFHANAQFPDITLVRHIAGLSLPVHITHAGDGSGRLFVVEQSGRIRIVKNGVLLATPFLDIGSTGANRVLSGGEQGLLSVAFPPGFALKGYFYVNYTRSPDGATVVARYFVTANPDIADSGREEVILTIDQPFPNHNGGQLAFGPSDGYLYIGMGDGGSGGDPNNFAQNLTDLPGNHKLLGKLLRIDVESGTIPYAVPPSNPILNGTRSEIWALGLRNPWRFSFDRLTHDLYIADVGQNLFEEIDFQPASSPGGENYGWRIMEGLHCFNPLDFLNPLPACNQTGLTLPVIEYGHTADPCSGSVTGGFVYRGNLYPQLQGIYFYGDACNGRFWGLKRNGPIWQNSLLLDSPYTITTFGEDEAGELYLADYAAGIIYKVTLSAPVDFDGDGKTDLAVYRSSTAAWFISPSGGGPIVGIGFGGDPSDIPVPGDYDRDGKTDEAVYRRSTGAWFILPSLTGAAGIYGVGFGGDPSDLPVPGDYDGDGRTDVAVYRKSTGAWFISPSGGGPIIGVGFGGDSSDIPVPGDYDKDGKTDLAVYRKNTGAWFIFPSGGGPMVGVGFGGDSSDIPAPGDYDGDGKTDMAVYRKSTGAWFISPSGGGPVLGVGFGGDPSDIPVPGNYDGEVKTDLAVYRKSTGAWFILPSGGGSIIGVGFGGDASDLPVTSNFASIF